MTQNLLLLNSDKAVMILGTLKLLRHAFTGFELKLEFFCVNADAGKENLGDVIHKSLAVKYMCRAFLSVFFSFAEKQDYTRIMSRLENYIILKSYKCAAEVSLIIIPVITLAHHIHTPHICSFRKNTGCVACRVGERGNRRVQP